MYNRDCLMRLPGEFEAHGDGEERLINSNNSKTLWLKKNAKVKLTKHSTFDFFN